MGLGGGGRHKTKNKSTKNRVLMTFLIQPYVKVNFGTSEIYKVNKSHCLSGALNQCYYISITCKCKIPNE